MLNFFFPNPASTSDDFDFFISHIAAINIRDFGKNLQNTDNKNQMYYPIISCELCNVKSIFIAFLNLYDCFKVANNICLFQQIVEEILLSLNGELVRQILCESIKYKCGQKSESERFDCIFRSVVDIYARKSENGTMQGSIFDEITTLKTIHFDATNFVPVGLVGCRNF